MSEFITIVVTLCAVYTVVHYTVASFGAKQPWPSVASAVMAVLFVLVVQRGLL